MEVFSVDFWLGVLSGIAIGVNVSLAIIAHNRQKTLGQMFKVIEESNRLHQFQVNLDRKVKAELSQTRKN